MTRMKHNSMNENECNKPLSTSKEVCINVTVILKTLSSTWWKDVFCYSYFTKLMHRLKLCFIIRLFIYTSNISTLTFYHYPNREFHPSNEGRLPRWNQADNRDRITPKHSVYTWMCYSRWTLLSGYRIHEVWRLTAFLTEMSWGMVIVKSLNKWQF